MWLPPARPLFAVALAVTSLTACGAGDGVSTREAAAIGEAETPPADESATSIPVAEPVSAMDFEIDWEPGDDGVEAGTLEVPVDYDDPDGATFELHLVRNPADEPADRIGSLLVNPGGPGFGGSDYARYAEQIYGAPLLERFDIIGWDPRGTGRTTPPIDCIDDYDYHFAQIDITPDDESERQAIVDRAEQFAEGCEERSAEILEHVGTNDSARDMEAMRVALGEEQISYLGFSYGSELGATFATLFPDSLRAAVLDGAADPTVGLDEGAKLQLAGFESSLDTFLERCAADDSCAFHNGGDAAAAFDELMQALDAEPIPSRSGRPDVNRAVAIQATATAMYSSVLWPQLEQALADAQAGDGNGLIDIYDSYFQRKPDGTWGNELEAFQAIVCMDTEERLTVEEEDAEADEFREVAPRLAPGTTGDYFCSFFPGSSEPRVEITGEGAGPIVVIGTTGDPATPLEGSRVAAESLDEGVLVVVDADEHTGYTVSECAQDVVHEYLVDLEPPADGTEC